MADTLYSVLLVVSIAALGLGCLSYLATILLKTQPEVRRTDRFSRMGKGCLAILLITASASFVVHYLYGHSAASAEPMNLMQFLNHHKIYFALAIGVVGLSALSWKARSG